MFFKPYSEFRVAGHPLEHNKDCMVEWARAGAISADFDKDPEAAHAWMEAARFFNLLPPHFNDDEIRQRVFIEAIRAENAGLSMYAEILDASQA